jgi:hypothetical protein
LYTVLYFIKILSGTPNYLPDLCEKGSSVLHINLYTGKSTEVACSKRG